MHPLPDTIRFPRRPRWFDLLDYHVIAVGGIIFLLLAGVLATITIVPSQPRPLLVLAAGLVPFVLFLEPMIVTRAFCAARRGRRSGYLIANHLVLLAYGLALGSFAFWIIPRS